MITGFEVGSVFRIIDEASPALRLILRQVRELNVALDKVRASLTGLGKSVVPVGLTTAVAETGALAKAWGALVALSSPSMPPSVRRDLEAKIENGRPISGPAITRARGGKVTRTGRPKRPADQPAARMAA